MANLVAYNSGRPIAEQRTYFPSAGWCLLLAVGFAGLRRRGSLLFTALLLIFTGLTANDVHAWRTPLGLWQRSIRFSPDVAGARCNLGNAYNAMQRPEPASAEYHAAARLSPGDPQVLNNLAVGLERGGDLDGAMASYRAALASSPRYAKARHNLAQLLIRLGRPDEAVQELDRILRDRPDYVPALVSRADLLGRQDRLDEAVGVLRQALSISPDHVDALFMLGRAYYLSRRFDEAVSVYTHLVGLRPDLAQAQSGLGLVLAARGRLAEAVRHLQQAAQLDPAFIEPRRALAGIAAREGRHDQAAALYAECAAIAQRLALSPAERLELLRLQARELDYAQRRAEAREVWRALLRLAPGDAEAIRALQSDAP